jgi:exonuclease SbcD
LGNHDGEGLFALVNSLIARRKPAAHPIYLVHRATLRGADYGVFSIPSKDGMERIRIGAVPFVNAASYVHEILKEGGELAGRVYSDQVGRLESAIGNALNAGYDPTTDVRIFAAHLLVDGAVVSGSERKLEVETDSYGTYSAGLPVADYLAFGHIHKPQPISGRPNGRYAGSCIQVDFGEVADKKLCYIIDAKPGLPVSIDERYLDVGRRLVDPTITYADLPAHADELRGTIVKLTLVLEGHERNISDYVRESLPGAYIARISEVYRQTTPVVSVVAEPGGPEPTVPEIFASYLATRESVPERERVGRYFTSLFESVAAGVGADLEDVKALHETP